MKKRKMEEKIKNCYESEVPDLSEKIIDSCKKERQESANTDMEEKLLNHNKTPSFFFLFKITLATVMCLFTFCLGFYLGDGFYKNGALNTTTMQASVYLDVNPSIELQIDENQRIYKCIEGNEDASEILDGLNLEGVEINTALTAIIGAMFVNGYITQDANSVLISVDNLGKGENEDFINGIINRVNVVFANSGIEGSLIVQNVSVSEDLKVRAQDNGISVGKMHLVDKMISGLEDYCEEDAQNLAEMSIKELNLIYTTRPKKENENDPFDKDFSSGAVGGFISETDALSALLENLELDSANLENYQIMARAKFGGSREIVYFITIKLSGDENIYEFEVDCKSGDIVKIDDKIQGNNNQDGNKEENFDGSYPNEDAPPQNPPDGNRPA